MSVTNRMRAAWARKALAEYRRVARGNQKDEADLRDLINDLLHLAHQTKAAKVSGGHTRMEHVDYVLQCARANFDNEIKDRD